MLDISRFSRVIFDCDGVILDSNNLKSDAFGDVAAEHSQELAASFVEYHRRNGGVSRYVKFEHFFRDMLGHASPEVQARRAVERYAGIVEEKLLKCDLISGVVPLLEKLLSLNVPCAINSGGDEEELKRVFGRRGLAVFFCHILGSPTSKAANMRRLADSGFLSGSCIFFGDSRSDWDAAKAGGCEFAYVSGVSEWKDGPSLAAQHEFPIIENFNQVSMGVG